MSIKDSFKEAAEWFRETLSPSMASDIHLDKGGSFPVVEIADIGDYSEGHLFWKKEWSSGHVYKFNAEKIIKTRNHDGSSSEEGDIRYDEIVGYKNKKDTPGICVFSQRDETFEICLPDLKEKLAKELLDIVLLSRFNRAMDAKNKRLIEAIKEHSDPNGLFYSSSLCCLYFESLGKRDMAISEGKKAVDIFKKTYQQKEDREPGTDEKLPSPFRRNQLIDLLDLLKKWKEEEGKYDHAYSLAIEKFHAADDKNIHGMEREWEESYKKMIDNFGAIEKEKRKVVLVVEALPLSVFPDFFPIKSDQHTPIRFDEMHPTPGCFYYLDPLDDLLYYRLDKIDEYYFRQKHKEAVSALEALCPKTIKVNASNRRTEEILTERNLSEGGAIKGGADLGLEVGDGKKKPSITSLISAGNNQSKGSQGKTNDLNTETNTVLYEYNYDLEEVERLPEYDEQSLVFNRSNSELKNICEGRMKTQSLSSSKVSLSLNRKDVIGKETLEKIENSLNLGIALSLGTKASKIKKSISPKVDFSKEKNFIDGVKQSIANEEEFSCVYEVEFFPYDKIKANIARKKKLLEESKSDPENLKKELEKIHDQMEETDWEVLLSEAIEAGSRLNLDEIESRKAFGEYKKRPKFWPEKHQFYHFVLKNRNKIKSGNRDIIQILETKKKDLSLPDEECDKYIEMALSKTLMRRMQIFVSSLFSLLMKKIRGNNS